MAGTLTKGYRKGFEVMGVDFDKKKSVCFYYNIGFEKMVKKATEQFKEMGLASTYLLDGEGAVCKQSDFDHKQDMALYLDEAYMEKYLAAFRKAYESIKDKVRAHGGPAAIEIFGEKDFAPVKEGSPICCNITLFQSFNDPIFEFIFATKFVFSIPNNFTGYVRFTVDDDYSAQDVKITPKKTLDELFI